MRARFQLQKLENRYLMTGDAWALEETFDADPSSPSQELLPNNFDYVVTHRTHPKEHFSIDFPTYPADHGDNCEGPNPNSDQLPQHMVRTDQSSNGDNPDKSFFICKNHMMSSMGDVSPYSISSFWPKQEFNFADGGTLEFDVNINEGFGQRVWWEVMITPRDQMKVAAGPTFAAIDETYPQDRIVLDFRNNVRQIQVGASEIAPDGWVTSEREWLQYDWAYWGAKYPNDAALADRRQRRTMRVEIEDEQITWGIETEDGSFDEFVVDVPGGLPFEQGIVAFKTHAYTPTGHGNFHTYTFHWDNIRFDGPVVGKYETHYADDVVYLQRNGDRPIGDSQTVNIELDELGPNPVLFGQVHQARAGQVELQINGGQPIEVTPFENDPTGCPTGQWNDWKSFRLELDQADLVEGTNTLTWTVAEAIPCNDGTSLWDGFSVKTLHIQTDVESEGSTENDTPPDSTELPCDFDGDGICDTSDLDALYLQLGNRVDDYNLDNEGIVDNQDVTEWLRLASLADPLGRTFVRGDTNLDGKVTVADFWQMAHNFGADGGWSDGNFIVEPKSGGGEVLFNDLMELVTNFRFDSTA